jgi:hypothetical protein
VGTRTLGPLSAATCIALAACSLLDEDTSSTEDALSCAKIDDPHCGHPLDRIVLPKLRAAGIAPRDGEPLAVCRRMALDLVGRIPSPAELERCVAASDLGARADLFLAMPEYLLTQQRGWGETIGFNTDLMWYGYGIEMDAMVGRLYSGAIDYKTFASDLVVYPGYYGLHQGDDWAANVIHVFLGRNARPDEIAGMRPIVRMFDQATFCDGAVYTATYDDAIADGEDEESAIDDASETCVEADTEEYAINFCKCRRGEGSVGCRSSALGTMIDIGSEGCANPSDETHRASFFRTDDGMAPGKRTKCTTPSGATKPCKDRVVDDEDSLGGTLRPAKVVDAGMKARLHKIGAALAARPDFWEAGADRELTRLIGWWKDGVRRPDFELPEIRTALANELKRTGSLRAIQRLIVTSLLYAAPSEPPPGFDAPGDADPSPASAPLPPLWSMASMKILTAESWLDAAGFATFGKPLGICDYRFVLTGEVPPNFNVDLSLVRRLDGPLPAFHGTGYAASVQMLGGCSADQPRPRSSTVGITYAQHAIARTLCATGTAILPPTFASTDPSDRNLGKAIDHVVRRTLSRPPTTEETTLFTAEMRECLAASGGCGNAEAAARWLCTRLIDSAEFAIY